MEILGTILTFIGGIVALISWIQILIVAFKDSIVWGLLSLFIPVVGLVYVFMHWAETKSPFFRYLIGFVIAVVGGFLAGKGVQTG